MQQAQLYLRIHTLLTWLLLFSLYRMRNTRFFSCKNVPCASLVFNKKGRHKGHAFSSCHCSGSNGPHPKIWRSHKSILWLSKVRIGNFTIGALGFDYFWRKNSVWKITFEANKLLSRKGKNGARKTWPSLVGIFFSSIWEVCVREQKRMSSTNWTKRFFLAANSGYCNNKRSSRNLRRWDFLEP